METLISILFVLIIVGVLVHKKKPDWWNKVKTLFKE